jgi:glycosyltransferase involved in cell wall biosynthesis
MAQDKRARVSDSTDQRRVLVLINGVVDASGGNLRAAVNIAEAMALDGALVTFSAPVVRAQSHRTVDLMDARIERRLFPASRPAARFGGSVRQLWWLWRNVRSFDEVQTHSLFALSAAYAIIVSAIRRVPVLLWPHGSIDPFDLRKHERFKRIIGPLVTRRLLDRCSALLFTTTHESRIAVTYGSRTPREVVALPVAPLSVEGANPAAWRKRHGVPGDVPVVLFLGRIDYKKRLPLLVEAVSLLEGRDAHLVVVGDGPAPERALMADAAARCGVTNRVHVTGWLEGTDRIEAFAVGDVFALISDAENFGLSLIEAMSVGCPAVISDRVFLAEDLERAGAVVCVERDAVAAAEAIDMLLTHPEKAANMGERARELVEREFAPLAVAARLREVTKALAQKR